MVSRPGGKGVNVRQRVSLPGAFSFGATVAMLKVWGRATSSNVQKVMWAVGELGIAHDRIDAGGPFGKLDTPEFLALNPNKLIPAIDDDGFTLWESNAIVRYLADTYGRGTLGPQDRKAFAGADQWMDWAATTIQPDVIGNIFMGVIRTSAVERNQATLDAAIQRVGDKLGLLDAHLAGRAYVGGTALTMADIALGSLMYRYFTLPISRPNLPNVEAWYARLQARPAYKAHVMIDYSALKVPGA
jgi:glutathione S-transferase